MASATISSEQFSTKASLGSISTLHYPIDLGNGRHGNYINFFIHTPQKSSYKLDQNNSFLSTPDGTPSSTSVFDSNNGIATDSIANQNARAFTTDSFNQINAILNNTPTNQYTGHSAPGKLLYYLKDTTVKDLTPAAKAVSTAAQAVMNFLVTGATTQLTDVISLYMPDTINMNQSMEYEGVSLTDALGKSGLVAAGATSIVDNISDLSDGINAESLRSLASNPVAMEQASGYLSGNKHIGDTDTTKLQKIALNKIGYALNPQIQILFKTIDFRTFQYDFLFTPNSLEEAETVTKIIKTFKYHAAPDLSSETLGRYFIPPSTFDIEYMMAGGVPNPNLHRISTCVLTTVSIDYSPRGFVTYDNGSPIQTRMTLQFQETEIMNKQRISEGF